jgi:hypothetical protein
MERTNRNLIKKFSYFMKGRSKETYLVENSEGFPDLLFAAKIKDYD